MASCSEQHEIGLIEIKGIPGTYVRLSQDDEFDSSTGVYFEIINDNDEIILSKNLLFGSLDYIESSSLFKANSIDSIIYITYYDPKEVYAIFDLKSGKGYPRSLNDENTDVETTFTSADSLFNLIKSQEPKLEANWKK